jgi:hypothetical protein
MPWQETAARERITGRLETIGPTPGDLMSRWQLLSSCLAIASIARPQCRWSLVPTQPKRCHPRKAQIALAQSVLRRCDEVIEEPPQHVHEGHKSEVPEPINDVRSWG